MAAFAGEVSVFAETNLGTRIAMNVPQDITAGAFKSKKNGSLFQVLFLLFSKIHCFYVISLHEKLRVAFSCLVMLLKIKSFLLVLRVFSVLYCYGLRN